MKPKYINSIFDRVFKNSKTPVYINKLVFTNYQIPGARYTKEKKIPVSMYKDYTYPGPRYVKYTDNHETKPINNKEKQYHSYPGPRYVKYTDNHESKPINNKEK